MNEKTAEAPRGDASPVETEHNVYGAPSGMVTSIVPVHGAARMRVPRTNA